ncbi:MAG: hypothetical protein KC646_00385 [Candidatus Cloacimonetes bacterium]|nr:hypothetical protein [Candidatus Cloacimonadota bacterium]
MLRYFLILLVLIQVNHAVKRASFKPRAREFKYMAPRVVSLEQHQIYGKDYIDIYLKFTTKVQLDQLTLQLSGIGEKAHILHDEKVHKKDFSIDIKFKDKAAKVQLRVLRKKRFGLLSFKLLASYDYPIDRVLEYIADRHKTDYLVDSARFTLIEKIKKNKGEVDSDFSLNVYGKKFLK